MFGRKKKAELVEDDSLADVDEATAELDDDDDAEAADDPADEPGLDEWALLDVSRDWREDGPFDADEVDLTADDAERVDLGAMIITPEKGMSIKLLASAETNQILHLVVESGTSALQITVYAAPATGNYCPEIRARLSEATPNAKITEFAEGPFGTELRRVLTVTDDRGREGLAPMRDWVIGGPRWVLDVRLMGQAAVGTTSNELEEFVHNLVIRRGDVAMVPGDILPLHPAGATAGAGQR
ncbi:MAG: DUF3710 domain-containing protein [Propionibacteriaceae bacterium]|jgi:hypothetical protein|nr:DUF3710 domain-containing protein [Propionibacteriaceae bacterium]